MLGTVQSLKCQVVFSEQERDNIYLGLKQGEYWELKAKEQEKALQLFDSLTSGMRERLELAVQKEEKYLEIIENKDKNYQALENLGDLRVKRVKVKSRKKIIIGVAVGVAVGIAIGIKTSK